jgi:hypothetical protein
MARAPKPITIDSLQDEVRFLLKTLLRDDVFHEEIKVAEAEKLLDNSLTVGFAEHCAFLKRHGFLDVDRAKNTVVVLARGRSFADGATDAALPQALAGHFASRLPSTASAATPAASGVLGGVLAAGAGLGNVLAAAAGSTTTRVPPRAVAGVAPERYQRGDALGLGSLGPVLLGRDTTLERDVVIKEFRHVFDLVTYVPREELLTRVKAAVMAQARLDHPHVLRVVDVQFAGDAPVLVLDRAVESLAARLARGAMAIDAVVRVLLQASHGLSAAHRQGVVHGGLKPENILFDSAGNVRLSDFGIARVAERVADPQTSAPPVYVGRGNPSYMAPEQLHKGRASAAGDVYSLGILLYEMLTGNLPGRRSPMPSASKRVVDAVGVERAAALDEMFDRMTRDPLAERFTSADDVLDALFAAFPSAQVGVRGTLLLCEPDPRAPAASVVLEEDRSDPSAAEVTAVVRAPPELRDPDRPS